MERSVPPARKRAVLLALLRAVLCSTGLVLLYYLLPLGKLQGPASIAAVAVALLGIAVVFFWQLHAILGSQQPAMRAVGALSVIVPYFLITFAAMYYLLDLHVADSFSQRLTRTDALYFTVTTFSTVGYGDITPVTGGARIAVMFQMISDLMIIGFGVKILVEAVQLRRQAVGSRTVDQPGVPSDR